MLTPANKNYTVNLANLTAVKQMSKW